LELTILANHDLGITELLTNKLNVHCPGPYYCSVSVFVWN